jgi:hypothetical protein
VAIYEGRAGNAYVLRRTASAVRLELFKDGDPKAADSTPTVAVVRDDGTTVTVGAVSSPAAGAYEGALDTTDTALLDILTATWTATVDSSVMTFYTQHEVIGAVLFTETALRNFGDRAVADAARYTDTMIAEARDKVTEQFQDVCGVSFVPRYAREALDGTGSQRLKVGHRRVTAIRSASIDGVAVTMSDITPYAGGWLHLDAGWTAGRQNVALAYEHGHARVPVEIRKAAMIVARYELISTDLSDRTISYLNDLGQFRLSIPDARHPTGIPAADEVLLRLDERSVLAS